SEFSVSELTLHTISAIEMAKTFTGCAVEINGKIGKPARIGITGTGHFT
ncbi:RNA 3'-phosphate cyclase, partial [Candidatus Bathyarchaeota archaeon]|nr:RNA 3'-phosphate cyclase [Candidatus Bathyarchaeota archaeon]